MAYELIIQKNAAGVDIALLSEKKLVEYYQESFSSAFQVGDFYLGKVKKISSAMNAAFIDVGAEKDAFLSYFDLGPNVNSVKKFTKLAQEGNAKHLEDFKLEAQTVKTGKISQVLKSGDKILVQVLKEPIANKGPKVSCDLSIAGRYFVLVPFSNGISISKKIGTPAEKKRLRDLASTLKTDNFGIIIRTVAEGAELGELDKDLKTLHNKWNDLTKGLQKANVRDLVLGEGNKLQTLLRDIFTDEFGPITINDESLCEEIKSYVAKISPGNEKMVKQYTGKSPLFENAGVNRQIKTLFGKNVSFSGGAYLVIEHTEALHVIDVNSGNMQFNADNRDEHVLKVNLEAVDEIARQIRLRDMGGIVVCDFIDMKLPKHKNDLYHAIRIAMKNDRARHTILPMTKFGLVQITRERVRPALEISTQELCPTCNGTGKSESNTQLFARLENNIMYLWENMNHKKIALHAHPMVAAYLTKGWPSIRMKWWMTNKKWLKVVSEVSYSINHYEIWDSNNNKIVND